MAELAGTQGNRISSTQLRALGASRRWVHDRVGAGRLVRVAPNVFAIPPFDETDDRGRWWGATLVREGAVISHLSAAVVWGALSIEGPLTTVTQHGNAGPRRYGRVLVYRRALAEGDTTTFNGLPITTAARTLIDISGSVSQRALARAVREMVRLERVTVPETVDEVERHAGTRGITALRAALARYSGLPLDRARSGAEVRALEILRDNDRPSPVLNLMIAGERADLSWPRCRAIIEIDGRPFHLDRGEDLRKASIWESAGWTVARIPADHVYGAPARLLSLVDANVPNVVENRNARDVRPAAPPRPEA
ncbi:hypothetical protein HJD18_14290 [Thermoleophilia bacterium SCSIO 60948]|nr:hypothetical protein HJD18_14290 [Thermoleophilia bacterium SCSIO 60948]